MCSLPIVSIVVPFWGLPYRILHKKLVKPKKGTTMETIGKWCQTCCTVLCCLVSSSGTYGLGLGCLGFRGLGV